MGYAATTINAVRDILFEASRVGGALEYIGERVWLAGPSQGVNLLHPFLVVRLPREPYSTEEWGGTGNLKNGRFVVEVEIGAEIDQDGDYPYGQDGGVDDTPDHKGALSIADDVMDALEAAYDSIKTTSPRVVDMTVSASAYERVSEAGIQLTAVVRIDFKIRFYAGAR